MNKIVRSTFILLLICFGTSVQARVLVGECQEFQTGAIFGIFDDYYVEQKFNPVNNGFGHRDLSGQALMRLPAINPMNAIWLTWDNRIILINQFGWQNIGQCNLSPVFVNANRVATFGLPQQYASVQMETYSGGQVSPQTLSIPAELLDKDIEFIKPAQPNLQAAQACAPLVNDRNAFMDCMAPKFLGKKERAYYGCMRQAGNESEMAICMLKENMGGNERAALDAAQACYQQYGNNWEMYPLCLAADNLKFDEKTARAMQCLQQSTSGGKGFDYLGMGICYAGPELAKGMNQESLIAMQCAMTSGGDPMTFAGCTGGQLAAMEINKCFTKGIGGDGCFGDGNTLVKTARNIEREIGQHFGPNSLAVEAWNAITTVPGPNHEAVKVVNNVVREMDKAGKNIEKEVRKVIPKIKIKW